MSSVLAMLLSTMTLYLPATWTRRETNRTQKRLHILIFFHIDSGTNSLQSTSRNVQIDRNIQYSTHTVMFSFWTLCGLGKSLLRWKPAPKKIAVNAMSWLHGGDLKKTFSNIGPQRETSKKGKEEGNKKNTRECHWRMLVCPGMKQTSLVSKFT